MDILALDIGKFNTVYCDYILENGEHEFGKVKTTPQAIHDLIVNREPHRVSMGALTCATNGRFQTVPRVSIFMVSKSVVTFK